MNWKIPSVIIIAAMMVMTGFVIVDSSNHCVLTYDLNGGTGDFPSSIVEKGASVNISDKEPTYKGFAFIGWSEYRYDVTGTIDSGDTLTVDKDTVLYAIWAPYGDIVVLSDPGLDDAVALCNLFEHADLFDSITIVAIGGNVEQSDGLKNVRKMVELCNMVGKVTVVSTDAIPQNHDDTAMIHGNDGLGDIYDFTPTVPYIAYAEWISGISEIDWLVSAGGCTVTKMILDTVTVNNFALMGGYIKCKPGYSDIEFNQMMDPEAFAYCVSKEHRCVTLDTGKNRLLDTVDWDIPDETTANKLFNIYQRNCIAAGDESIAIWDDVTITYVLHPHFFTHKKTIDSNGLIIDNLTFVSDHYETCGMSELI